MLTNTERRARGGDPWREQAEADTRSGGVRNAPRTQNPRACRACAAPAGMMNQAEKDRTQNEKILRVVKEQAPKDFADASTRYPCASVRGARREAVCACVRQLRTVVRVR